ncbi:lysoplasmalogenase-like [Penaeus japonicus]|uniref:lysoplasmalogenase-like n=1 Tax=Penaeus japonicus TaxID=27405 RepID=UPI001C71713B|nr:lysoplasmalogenase-like [Penaeus japonicus]XP_042890360.1 lysoplasmalogenase-like [Penaeus japonicus]
MSPRATPTWVGPPHHHTLVFLASVGASLAWFVPARFSSLKAMFFKCLPVVILIDMLRGGGGGGRGRGGGGGGRGGEGGGEDTVVFQALVLSLLGDALLVWPNYFLPGTLAFGAAHCLYIYAWGLRQVDLVTGVTIYLSVAVCLACLLPKAPAHLRAAVTVYSFVLVTMLWAALNRYRQRRNLTWQHRACTLAGAIIFVISDASLALLQGLKLVPFPYGRLVTILTYYTSQFLIVIGTDYGTVR